MVLIGRLGKYRPRQVRARLAILAALTLVTFGIVIAGTTPANAGTDDYPTSIAGCHYVSNPTGPAFTCDLKDSTQDTLIDPWHEYNRECTSFVAWRLSYRNGFTMPFNDNAYAWGADAHNMGYTVDMNPAVGSVAWWNKSTSMPNGHVAWVESISGSNVTVEEYNDEDAADNYTPYVYSEDTIAASAPSGYIHFKDLSSSSSGYRSAFQANTGYLYTYDTTNGAVNTSQGMKSGTSPSIANNNTSNIYEVAFQANNDDLYTYDTTNGAVNTSQGMASGTSPSIAYGSSTSYEIAFQANNGYLYTYNSSTGAASTTLGMASGTSPAITYVSGIGYEVAFQANTGNLYTYDTTNGAVNTGDGMASGTSPSIATSQSGGYEIAFQANTGDLYTYNSSSGTGSTTLGMASGTSPSIAYGYKVAFQANTGYLYTYDTTNGAVNTSQGMKSGTSPSIGYIWASSLYEVAFQANTGYLYTYDTTNGAVNTSQGMAAATSPSIGANSLS
jgi:surface antigen